MRRSNKALLYILIDSFTYSLIPVLAALSINNTDIISFLTASIAISLIAYILYFKYQIQKIPNFFSNTYLKYVLIAGIGFILSHLTLFYSIQNSNNEYLPSIIFQVYPLIVMLFLIYFKMSNEVLTKNKFGIVLLSFIGIVILNYNPTLTSNHLTVISVILPILSAIFLALSIVYTIKLSKSLKKTYGDIAPVVANFYSKIISFIVIIPFMLWYLFSKNVIFTLNINTFLLIFTYGILALTVGTIYYYRGLSITTKSLSIHTLSYISAILSVLWLWLLGFGEMTPHILIGSAFILVSITLLHFNVEKNYAYYGSIIWTLFAGTYIYLENALILKNYYTAISVPLIFFVISLAFLLDRISKRTDDEEKLVIEIIENAINDNKDNERLINIIIKINTTTEKKTIKALYQEINPIDLCSKNKFLINKFILSKIQKVKFSEMFVLFLTAFLALFVTIFFEPSDTNFNNIFKLCLSTAIIFNLLYIYDNEKERGKNFILTQKQNNQLYSYININMHKSQTITERTISIILLIFIFSIFFKIYNI